VKVAISHNLTAIRRSKLWVQEFLLLWVPTLLGSLLGFVGLKSCLGDGVCQSVYLAAKRNSLGTN
jgi:hypothetical protein